jgi:ABC-type Fe3+-hydroxamate transport system substrate-binding protein
MREIFSEVLGKKVVLPQKCERIVSFSPSITEALFMMGLGGKIKGVSVYCVRPPDARKKIIIGSYSTYKREKLLEINPDIIFTTTGYQLEFAKKLSDEFPVWPIRLPSNLADVISTCCEAGLAAGYPDEARQLERKLIDHLLILKSQAEKINSIPTSPKNEDNNHSNNNNNKIKVYVEIDLGGPTTFGAYSYITDALDFLGLENIFSDEPKEWLRPDDKVVSQKNPDVIIYEPKMFSKRREKEEIIKKLFERFGEIKAIKNKNVFITPGIYDFLAHHGPSFITETLQWILEIKKKFVSS